MTARSKLTTGLIAMTLALGAQGVYACASCGCSGTKPKADAHKHGEAETCPSGACSMSSAPKDAAHDSHNINTFQMKAYVDSGEAILLDARSANHDDGYRIPGAKSLNDKSTPAEIAAVIPSKESKVVTYCSNLQCPASSRLANHLMTLGYTSVKEYPEGIAGWRKAGASVDKVK